MPDEPMGMVQVRMPVRVHALLKQHAKDQERSVNWLINRILESAVAKRDEPQLKGVQP